MSNDEWLVENLTVGEPFGTNDHCVIKWDMVTTKIKNNNYNRVIFDYFNVDYEQLREVVLIIDWNDVIKVCNVVDDWVAFEKVIIIIRDKYLHKTSCKVSFKAKWVIKEVTKFCRLKIIKYGKVMLN